MVQNKHVDSFAYNLLFIILLFAKENTIYSQYLKVEVHPQPIVSQSKFFGPRKIIYRYKQCEFTEAELFRKIGNISKLYL